MPSAPSKIVAAGGRSRCRRAPNRRAWRRLSMHASALAWAALAAVAAPVAAQPTPAQPSPSPSSSPTSASAPAPSTTSAMTPAQADALSAAIAERRAGRYEAAFAALRALTQQSPNLARPWHELGILYTLHGQLDDARRAFETALGADAQLAAARRSLAEVLRADGRYREAALHYRVLVAERRGGVASLRGLATCLLAGGERDDAKATLGALRLADPSGEDGAWAAERLAALERAEAAGAAAPADIREVEVQAGAHFAAGRYHEAADLYGAACREAPTAERCYRQAVALLAKRRYLDAVGALRAALAVDRGHLPALSAWPTALRKLREEGHGGMVVELGAAASVAPARASRALLEGDLLLAERLTTAALQGAAASGAPAPLTLLLIRAEARLRRGDPRRAKVDFEAVLRRAPAHKLARAGAIACALAEGRVSWARDALALPAPPAPPEGVELPAGYDPNADLDAWRRWRSDEFDHRLRMAADPGIKPRAPFSPPPRLDVEALRPAPAAVDPGADPGLRRGKRPR